MSQLGFRDAVVGEEAATEPNTTIASRKVLWNASCAAAPPASLAGKVHGGK